MTEPALTDITVRRLSGEATFTLVVKTGTAQLRPHGHVVSFDIGMSPVEIAVRLRSARALDAL